ncbi:MAG TPA: C40 family peptidase [Gemmatimonadaceae bacterium]|nr:C40 family peptidase [Gemmatimonadaceae bacterium]
MVVIAVMTTVNARFAFLLCTLLAAPFPALGQARQAPTPTALRTVQVRAPVRGEDVVRTAKQYLGVRYVLGGTTPRAFDCSGFVRWIFAQHGVNMPRTAKEQAAVGDAPPPGDLQPGDLLFFFGGSGAQHIAVYVGGDTIIHASSSGKRVKLDRFGGTRRRPTWFGQRLIAVRRILPAEGVVELPVGALSTDRGVPPELETTLLYREPPVVY